MHAQVTLADVHGFVVIGWSRLQRAGSVIILVDVCIPPPHDSNANLYVLMF